MLFNSLGFLLFFPIVVLLYWILPQRLRNVFLLVASYYFYMNWEPIYALLILFSSVTTWGCAMLMQRDDSRRKFYFVTCLVLNFLILGIFKYAGFVASSVHDVLSWAHISMQVPEFELLLPVGISFYIFQAVGYTIDVYRRTIAPESNLMTYCLFVSFFPQLVAGPIERAKNLLSQFHSVHRFSSDKVINGLYVMMWGYFMKLCIAENVSTYVDAVFNNLPYHTGTSVWLAAFFFTFQIFCDFGGYSLIAIGAARCMGFSLMRNFNHPYCATSIKEFWRRWHISLTTWFTDYVYIPLGGNRCSTMMHQRNLLSTFLISGLWHGANWTFVLWGGYHGLLQCGYSLKKKYRINFLPSNKLLTTLSVCFTFLLVMLGWVLFRANTVSDAMLAFKKMAVDHGPLFNGEGKPAIALPLILIVVLMIKEWRDYRQDTDVTSRDTGSLNLNVLKTALLIVVILACANFDGGQFIYFQF